MNIKQTKEGWNIVEGDSHISKWVEDSGTLVHDKFLPSLVCNHLDEGSYVIDAGANIGSHTLAYSNAVFSPKHHGMVIAIEPGSLCYACLKANAALFPHQNVYALQAGVGELDGITLQHKQDDNLGASTCSIVADKDRILGEKYVLTVTLDFIAHQANHKIAFVKLDVEGFEVKALLGAVKDLLPNHRPKMLIEVNQGALAAQGDSEKDIIDILEFHDYKYEIAQPQCKLGDAMFDLLCIPNIKTQLIVEK